MKDEEITEFAKKYLDVELYPHQKLFIEMLQGKPTPQQLREKAIDKMVIDRVSRALTGYRIRKPSVLNAILREIYIVTDPEFVGGMKADLIVIDDINEEAVGSDINGKALREALEDEEIDLSELGQQYASEREGYDDR